MDSRRGQCRPSRALAETVYAVVIMRTDPFCFGIDVVSDVKTVICPIYNEIVVAVPFSELTALLVWEPS